MSLGGFDTGFDSGFGWYGKGYLSIVVGNHPTYEDEDIVGATNWRRCRHFHAESICHVKYVPFNTDGLNPYNSLPEVLLSNCCQYKWERIGIDTIRRTNLWTLDVVEYGSTPIEDPDRPGRMIHCDVDDYFDMMVKHPRHRIFGILGAETQYGGRTNASHAKLDTVWQEIEAQTAHREMDYAVSPFGDYRKRLVVAVDNFDDETSGELTSPLIDEIDPENPVTAKKRKYSVRWRGLRDVIEADVLDKGKVVRIDGIRKHVRSEIVSVKVLP